MYTIGWDETRLRSSNVKVFEKKYQNNAAERIKETILEAFRN